MHKFAFNAAAALAGVAVTTALVAGVTLAADGGSGDKIVKFYTAPGAHADMMAAIEKGDYDAWYQAATSVKRIEDIITREKFPRFVEMHRLMQSGDFAEAKKIADELGLPAAMHIKHGRMMGRGFMGMHHGEFFPADVSATQK